ncbi:hypothetical protein [Candidatus Fokinia solitaria]|uniref:hypothetical protein n=1 Tax=Candidatus Fokinia solitaria TaxID=1802984 RepID=UPI0030B9A7EE
MLEMINTQLSAKEDRPNKRDSFDSTQDAMRKNMHGVINLSAVAKNSLIPKAKSPTFMETVPLNILLYDGNETCSN